MNKLKEVLDRCKCGVHVVVNEHRNYYETVEEKLKELSQLECPPNIPDAVRAKMIELNTIIDVQLYPNTPNGSYSIFHYDIDVALDEALEFLES